MGLFNKLNWNQFTSFDPADGGYGFTFSVFAVVLVWVVFDRSGR